MLDFRRSLMSVLRTAVGERAYGIFRELIIAQADRERSPVPLLKAEPRSNSLTKQSWWQNRSVKSAKPDNMKGTTQLLQPSKGKKTSKTWWGQGKSEGGLILRGFLRQRSPVREGIYFQTFADFGIVVPFKHEGATIVHFKYTILCDLPTHGDTILNSRHKFLKTILI